MKTVLKVFNIQDKAIWLRAIFKVEDSSSLSRPTLETSHYLQGGGIVQIEGVAFFNVPQTRGLREIK